MTFEEKLNSVADIEFQFIEKPTDGGEILHNNGLHYKKQSFCEGARWARQETLREVMPSLKFLLHCVSQTPWIAEGPGDITNPMFLGTGSVDGDQEVHGKYINVKELLEKLEAEK